LEAAALLPPDGAIGGWASAYWRGVRLLDGGTLGPATSLEPILLILGPNSKIRPRLHNQLARERLQASDVESYLGLRRTGDLRTAFDGARRAPNLYNAVTFIDMMLTTGLVTKDRLRRYWSDHAGWRGVPQARRALSLAEPGSRSPPETTLRLLWVAEAGFPTPLVNPPVFSLDGRLLGYPDLLDPEAAVVLEYDGDDHATSSIMPMTTSARSCSRNTACWCAASDGHTCATGEWRRSSGSLGPGARSSS
jgi:hypothetical protein